MNQLVYVTMTFPAMSIIGNLILMVAFLAVEGEYAHRYFLTGILFNRLK